MISLLIVILIAGLILYVINMLPIDGAIKNVAYVVFVVFLLIYLIEFLAGSAPGWYGPYPR